MQVSRSLSRLMAIALLIATTVVIGRFFVIPIPMTRGYFNLTDVGIAVAALLFGRTAGGVVGACSGFLLDLISGYPQYMFFSLVIHGLEGLIIGQLTETTTQATLWREFILAGIVVVAGYFGADSFLYAPAAAVIGLLPNTLQVIVGYVGGYLLVKRLRPLVLRRFQ